MKRISKAIGVILIVLLIVFLLFLSVTEEVAKFFATGYIIKLFFK